MIKILCFPSALALSVGVLGIASVDAARAADVLGKASWALLSPPSGAKLIPATGNVLHVAIYKSTPQYYQVQLTHNLEAAIPAKASLHYQLWARSTTKNPVHIVIEKQSAPYTHYLDQVITLTPTWKHYDFKTTVPTAYGPNGLAGRLQFGQKAGSVEFKSITITTAK